MSEAKRLVEVAVSQIGYREGANNNTKYGAWYGLNYQPWCAMFVSWCADQAGIPTSIIPKFAYVPNGIQFFRNQGRYYARGQYTPVSGDLIFYGDSDHVGIVERVANNVVITVEGNTGSTGATANGDGVYRRNWPLTSTWIKGYGHPAYGEEEDDVEIKEISIRDLDRDRLIQVSAVNIEGTNYIRLRDTEKLFPVTVSFDQAAATPTIALNYTK